MGQSFKESGRYAPLHTTPDGPGDARPTSLQILNDNNSIGELQDKVVLITGGSNGIGVDEVRALAKTGARVFFTSRDPAKGEKVKLELLKEVENGDGRQAAAIEMLKMDLQSLESVKAGVEDFKAKSDKLNILINNAGIAMTPHGFTKEGHEQQFGVNHLAHFYLFQLLKPMLLSSSNLSFNSRVVAVASSVHTLGSVHTGDYNFEKHGYEPILAYAQSKTCNIWFANELERRYGSKQLHGISVHPGGIETGLQRSHDEKSRQMIQEYLKVPHIAKALKSIEQGSASVVLAAIGKEYEGVGGFYLEDCGMSPPMSDNTPIGMPGYKPWAYDEVGERQLWIDSLKMLDLPDDQHGDS